MLTLFGIRRKLGNATNTPSIGDDEPNWKLAVESRHLLSIFPELVWRNIIKYLDTRSFQNVINSSLFFRNLVNDKITEFLFKDVFEIVAPRLVSNGYWTFDTHEWEKDEVKAVILKCRLVCRSWNTSLSELAQETFNSIPERQRRWLNRDKNAIFWFIDPIYNFEHSDKIDKFVQKFVGFTSNPFFGKTILLTVPAKTNDINRDFRNKIELFLDFFGDHVSNCEIDLHHQFDLEKAYLDFIDLLWVLPNLKRLRIQSPGYRFNKLMATTRMPPTFEKLQSLELQCVCSNIRYALVWKNLQISGLSNYQSTHAQTVSHLLYPYENLSHLALEWYNWKDIWFFNDCNIKWRLKSLALKDYYTKQDKTCVTWTELFSTLSNIFGKLLEDLELGLPEMVNDEDRSKLVDEMLKYRLNFPKLKKLNLHVTNCVPFDFLLGISESLEVLHIKLKYSHYGSYKNVREVGRKETVKFWSCFCKYSRSLLWKSFPKLKTVSYFRYGYTHSFRQYDWEDSYLRRNFCKLLLTVCCAISWTGKALHKVLIFQNLDDIFDDIIV